MNSKIYSIIITYNPDFESLRNLINILVKQTYKVIICNNSLDDIIDLHDNDKAKIHIINFGQNLGIAKAQSIGMKWAFDDGAEFILQMDQDSTPADNMVEELFTCYNNVVAMGFNPGLIGAQDYDKYTKEINKARLKKGKAIKSYKSYKVVDSTLSSGSLIPKNSYEVIGGMRDDLFIDAVDHEYCWRLRYAGFCIIRNCNALLAHRLGDGRYEILKVISVGMPNPFRHYYATRNIFLLLKEKHVPFYWKFSSIIKLFLKIIFYPIFLPKGFDRLKFFLKGVYDGFAGRRGILK